MSVRTAISRPIRNPTLFEAEAGFEPILAVEGGEVPMLELVPGTDVS